MASLPLPVLPQTTTTSTTMGATTPYPYANRNYAEMLQGNLDYFMNPNSQLIQQARQRGMEVAATRGGINSSIAAGAAEREALGVGANLAQSAMASQLGQEQALLNNWMETQQFGRQMASLPFTSSLEMLQRIGEYSLEDPQLYTPAVVSGMSNFFNQNMRDIMSQYFPNGT